MPRKAKATGTVEFVNKPETAPEPSILPVVPHVAVPEQGSPTAAPPPPVSPVLPVKGKRTYNKKNGEYWKAVSKDRKSMLQGKPEPKVEPVPEPKNEIIMPTPELVQEAPKKAKGRPRKATTPAPAPVPVPTPAPAPPAPVKQKKEKKAPVKQAPPPKPVKPVKAKPVKKVRVYEPSSEEESDYDSESESDDEAPVEVVAKKAVRRLKTLKKIDERIGQLNNSYSARGYSVF
jgi:hypothetical protein